jgi:predicted NodU family carbamoyl transferase
LGSRSIVCAADPRYYALIEAFRELIGVPG